MSATLSVDAYIAAQLRQLADDGTKAAHAIRRHGAAPDDPSLAFYEELEARATLLASKLDR